MIKFGSHLPRKVPVIPNTYIEDNTKILPAKNKMMAINFMKPFCNESRVGWFSIAFLYLHFIYLPISFCIICFFFKKHDMKQYKQTKITHKKSLRIPREKIVIANA